MKLYQLTCSKCSYKTSYDVLGMDKKNAKTLITLIYDIHLALTFFQAFLVKGISC